MCQPVYNAILARRSVRSFKEEPVKREKIDLLLRAAMAAPSACNLQPWVFVVVDEPVALEAVKAATTQGQYNAPLAIVVCGVWEHIPWDGEGWQLDCGMAAENMMLEAVELGLASLCVGGFEEDALRACLNLPEGVQPVAVLEFGVPAVEKAPRSWYTPQAVHWQRFDPDQPRTYRTLEMLQEDIKKGIL